VHVELALLSHVFEMAIQEWRVGLTVNSVRAIRCPAPGAGRYKRPSTDDELRLRAACDAYRNPMLSRMVRLALNTAMRAGEIQRLR
jgi:integrase